MPLVILLVKLSSLIVKWLECKGHRVLIRLIISKHKKHAKGKYKCINRLITILLKEIASFTYIMYVI